MKEQINNEYIHYGRVQNDTTIYDNLSNEIKQHRVKSRGIQ